MMVDLWLEKGLAFLLFWGIWLLAPLLVDIIAAMVQLITVRISMAKEKPLPELEYIPLVSIIIPVHNSEATLYKCLISLSEQSYPRERMQIICANNGSQDQSFACYNRFQAKYRDLNTSWISMQEAGKSIALNAGIYTIIGELVMNVDSDARLETDAIYNMVAAFVADPDLAAATGAIHIDKPLGKGTNLLDIVHYCEEIEYLVAFNVGRRYQALTNSLFTLAGAFSGFRRDVIYKTFMYSEHTVSEDTEITFQVRKQAVKNRWKIGCVHQAIAYVEPISSMERLYAQRVRWQRGQLEVSSLYLDHDHGFLHSLRSFIGWLMVTDHTLAFSRLTWTFIIPFLYFLGYPLVLVISALGGFYICYMLLDYLYYLTALQAVDGKHRRKLQRIWYAVIFLSLFRFLTYWFRLAGILNALAEDGKWKVDDPVKQLKEALKHTWQHRFWQAKSQSAHSDG